MSTSNLNDYDPGMTESCLNNDVKRFADASWECVANPNGILHCKFKGWSSKSNNAKFRLIVNEIMADMNWAEKPWVLIYDCAKLTGMDIAARGKLIEVALSLKNLRCVIVNSSSHLVRSLVKLTVTFYNPPFSLSVCDDICESYKKASECLGLIVDVFPQNVITEKNEQGTDNIRNKDVDTVLKILGGVEWNKPGVKFLEEAALHSPWKPFLSMMAIIKGDLDIMLQKREERLTQLEERNREEITLQQKMSEALEASQNAKILCEKESQRNIMLTRVVVDTQKEILFSMGEIIESRSKETANHIRRVAEYSALLAKQYDLNDREQQHILHSSPMHDAGKIAIPDAILNKPGKLTDEEFAIMKDHTRIGWEMLKGSKLEIMQLAAVIANQHHEKWNGKGYPGGLKGDEIHIYGRIVALADVFDALGSDRCYKKAWPLDKILELLQNERGQHFDPDLIDLFLGNIDGFLVIRERFPDAPP